MVSLFLTKKSPKALGLTIHNFATCTIVSRQIFSMELFYEAQTINSLIHIFLLDGNNVMIFSQCPLATSHMLA
jgi:hypothetical protein